MRMKIIGEAHGDEPTPPHQLSRIAEAMLKTMAEHEESEPAMRAMVVIFGEHLDHGPKDDCGMSLGFASAGYTDSERLINDFITALRTVAEVQGARVIVSVRSPGMN